MAPRKDEKTPGVKKGDKVEAKWSGSNVYYDATVLEAGSKLCRVLFEDGSERSVKTSDVKAAKPRSSSRSRGRPRSLSAGRKALPSRSRSRSPARKATPKPKVQKKTPSKAEKDSNSIGVKGNREISVNLKNYSSVTSTETINDKRVQKEIITEKIETEKESRSSIQVLDKDLFSASGSSVRTSARIAALQIAKSQEESGSSKTNATGKHLKSFSDDESEDEDEDEFDGPKKVQEHKLFWIARSFGSLLMILFMPAFVITMYSACPKKHCTVLEMPKYPQRLSLYLDLKSAAVYTSVVLLQAVLMMIPIGRQVRGFPFGPKSTVLNYRLNGFISLLVSIAVLCTLGYFNISLSFGCDKFFSMMCTSIIFSFALSIIMHVKARWALPHQRNPKANSGSVIFNFLMGREINPRIGRRFDLKLYAMRFGATSWALVLICCLYKSYFSKSYLDVSLLLVASMQMFYLFDAIFREEVILSSAAFVTDGFGYEWILPAFTIMPFANTIQALYLVNHGTKAAVMPYWCSAAIVAMFFCGYYIALKSSNTKHDFRRNPYSPALAHVDSIPTSKKKRLIISGWWGIIRHPNYLGELIMTIAWTLPCGFNHFIPFCPLLFTVLIFVARALQIDAECKQKYGPAWQCYTEKVRSRIIPYIF